jgi:F0F1-type ATP synthase delta subunit
MFEKDAAALQVADNDLQGIAQMARRAKSLEKEIEDYEAELKQRKEQFRKLTEEAIPEALTGLGLKSFKMEDGSSIEVKAFYSASITEARRAEAFQWLRENGYDDIIKNTISVRFGRGEEALCAQAVATLREAGYPVEQAEKVEPMTLKAWVKEQVEKGREFPSELFGAYIGQKATIKSV